MQAVPVPSYESGARNFIQLAEGERPSVADVIEFARQNNAVFMQGKQEIVLLYLPQVATYVGMKYETLCSFFKP